MGLLVSSVLHYAEAKPGARFPEEQVNHELEHLKIRERVSGAISITGTLLAVVVLVGLIAGGPVLFGALAAIALVAGVYTYFCRQAESSLKTKQIAWQQEQPVSNK